jgi:5-methylcytosine-specific restriction endonuclease McrA
MMSGHVLVLNQDYGAITICSVRRAFILVLLKKAELVHARDDRVLRSPSSEYPWPSIIRLKQYASFPYRKVMLSRANVHRRDGGLCQYCGKRDRLTIDHIMPKSRGGRDTWDNLASACVLCNNRKGDRTPEEAEMSLMRKPFRPSHVMFIRDYVGNLDEGWKPYLFIT